MLLYVVRPDVGIELSIGFWNSGRLGHITGTGTSFPKAASGIWGKALSVNIT